MAEGDELDVFTNATLVLVLVFGIASAITTYSDALVERALVTCEIAPASLQDCMKSKGYVPTRHGSSDERAGWQSDRLHRLLGDVGEPMPDEDDKWQKSRSML
jgi:hypothetical protein